MLTTLHLAITSALVGLIWGIQVVKYPGFRFLSEENFKAYHDHHARSITHVVLPLMVSELGLVIFQVWENGWTWPYLVPLILVAGIWVSTFTLQVPMHNILSEKKDERAIEKLIRTNWIRTVLWTVEAVWLLM